MTPPAAAPRRVLVIQLRRLGDVVLTTPLVEDLHSAFPDAAIDFLVGARAAPLLDGLPNLHERIVYDPARAGAMRRLVRAHAYDWIIDVQSNPRTALLTLLSGARVRVGWRVTGWGSAYTHRLARSGRPPEYVVRERQRLLELVGVPVSPRTARLGVSTAERAAAESALRALGAPEGKPRAAMVLSAGESAKEWSVERFADVATALEAGGTVPVLLPAPGDEAKVAAFRARTAAGIIADAQALRPCMALMASCSVLLSADTGPAHMAMALGVPTVTIYGPRPPVLWNPGRADTLALWAGDEGCCHRDRCVLDGACMAAITVAQVLDTLHSLLVRPAAQGVPRSRDSTHGVHHTEGMRHE